MVSAPMENDIIDLLNESLKIKETIKKTRPKELKNNLPISLEKHPIYSYPDYYNIIPCYIAPYLDEKGEKITKFPLKWEKLMTEKYPKAKLLQDIQTIIKKGKYNSLAVMNGAISNNLIILDFDLNEEYNSKEFFNLIIKHLPILKNTLTEKSYRGGYHFHLLVDDMSCYESLDKKKIFETIFGDCCNEIGIQGERKLTFIWSGNKYKVINKVPPLKISNEQFLEIIESIKITTPEIKKETVKKLTIGSTTTKVDKKFKNLRTPFEDIFNGFIELDSYAKATKQPEKNYWRGAYFEGERVGMSFEETAKILSKSQQREFDWTKTKAQIKDVRNRYEEFKGYYETWFCTKKGWEAHFPNYPYEEFKKPKKKKRKKTVSTSEISKNIKKKYNIYCPVEYKQTFLIYENGNYIEKDYRFLDVIMLEYFEANELSEMTDSSQSSKLLLLKRYLKKDSIISIKEFDINPFIRNINNGILDYTDLNDIKLLPHHPKYKTTIRLPVNYKPELEFDKNNIIHKFISRLVEKEHTNVIYEAIGDTLQGQPDKYQKSLLLFGLGGEGKGTLFDLIEFLLGSKNCNHIPLYKLSNDKHMTAELENKLANFGKEISNKRFFLDVFKMLITDKTLHGNKKYGKVFEFLNHCKQFFSANVLFELTERNRAIFRRMILLHCKNIIPEDDIDINYLEKLTTPKNLSILFNKSLEGLKTLQERGHYEKQYNAIDNIEKLYDRLSNPFINFFGEYLIYSEEERNNLEVNKHFLLQTFNYYSEYYNLPPITALKDLTREINKLKPNINIISKTHRIEGIRTPYYKNIEIKRQFFEDFSDFQEIEIKAPNTPTPIQKKAIDKFLR